MIILNLADGIELGFHFVSNLILHFIKIVFLNIGFKKYRIVSEIEHPEFYILE